MARTLLACFLLSAIFFTLAYKGLYGFEHDSPWIFGITAVVACWYSISYLLDGIRLKRQAKWFVGRFADYSAFENLGKIKLRGRARSVGTPQVSLANGKPCVWWHRPEEADYEDTSPPFYLDDKKGRYLIDPKGAEVYEEETHYYGPVISINTPKRPEKVIGEGSYLYVMGKAVPDESGNAVGILRQDADTALHISNLDINSIVRTRYKNTIHYVVAAESFLIVLVSIFRVFHGALTP